MEDIKIDLSDREHLKKLGVKFSDEPLYVKFNKGSKFDEISLKVSQEMEDIKIDKKVVDEEYLKILNSLTEIHDFLIHKNYPAAIFHLSVLTENLAQKIR